MSERNTAVMPTLELRSDFNTETETAILIIQSQVLPFTGSFLDIETLREAEPQCRDRVEGRSDPLELGRSCAEPILSRARLCVRQNVAKNV